MRTINRSCDVILGTEMEELGGLKSFPIYMGCVEQPQSDDIYVDMLWHISPQNGLLQLMKLIPLEILYSTSHMAGAVGNVWMQHHKAFATFISQYQPKSVLEIGGAHGILSKIYDENVDSIDWTIIEPDPIPHDDIKTNFIKGFFDEKFVFEKKVDAIIHSHVFEHIYDPCKFVENISKFLDQGEYLIFSLPNMKEMLERKYTNCINFEHTIFLTEPYIEYLLSRYGFKIIKREYFLDDHSIFYACVRDKNVSPITMQSGLYEQNKKIYMDYVAYHEELIRDINLKVATLSTKHNIYLFGAHVFAQYLVAFGLNTKNISSILDNDFHKHGKRLYGTDLKVASPKILANESKPVVILKAGAYNEEIKKDIILHVAQ